MQKSRDFWYFKKNPDFSLTPGLSYIRVKETQECGCLGIDAYSYLDFSGASIYTKILYTPGFVKKNNWNLGLITGYQFYTDEKSISESWNFNQHDENYHIIREKNLANNSFFKAFYFGLTTGIQFNFVKMKFIKPAFEFSFYPVYAKNVDQYAGDNPKGNERLILGSFILGFGAKQKRLPE